MGVVKGAISIKDNMSAVLRSIKQEQSAFRRDVQRTRRELESTWDQRRTARLDATAANRTAQQLRQRVGAAASENRHRHGHQGYGQR